MMLKDLLELGRTFIDLLRQSRQQDDKIKRLQDEVSALSDRLDEFALALRDLAFQLDHDREIAAMNREMAAKDRELLRSQLESALLRFERRLPPGKTQGDPPERS